MQPKQEDRGEPFDGTWQGLPPGVSMTPESDLNEQTLPTSMGASARLPESDDPDGDDSADDESSSADAPSGDDAATLKKHGGERSQEWDMLPPPRIARGQEIFGKYRLVEKLGEGGMGDVWLVDNLELGRKSALKLLKPQVAHNDKGWKRFRREARLMAKLEHPNAIVVHDFKRTQSIGYIEMEFVRGRSLDRVIEEHKDRPIPLDQIMSILDQLCAVLQEAHGHVDEETGKPKPIIHRDLKPSNIMVLDHKPWGQNIKVLDFGIAKMVEEESAQEATLTNVGDVLGTPAFMSPEQVRGGWGKHGEREVDCRSDLYSVGVILYQLLTGKIPFTTRDPRGLMAAHLTETPRSMRQANPSREVPPAVEQVVMQCLEKDPSRRPASAAELARIFRAAVGGRSPRRRWLAPLLLCAAPLLLGGLALGVWKSRGLIVVERKPRAGDDSPSPPAPPTPPRPKAKVPAGYQAVEGSGLAEGTDEPAKIRRSDDGLVLLRQGAGVYLPEGFEPDPGNPLDKVGRWPRFVVRKESGSRFILVPGGTYLRGDSRSEDSDGLGKPLRPHWVRVQSFYMQETEVTNHELEAYYVAHSETHELLSSWRNLYDRELTEKKPSADAGRLPAGCISYQAASRFARAMGGMLPTEAQWEMAAKSGHDDYLYPWGKEQTRRAGEALRANVNNPSSGPAFVGTFPKDRTAEQHILDMAGNVRELCRDAYKPYSDLIHQANSRENPLIEPFTAPESAAAANVIVRGSSFLSTERKARVFYRNAIRADESPPDVGFRMVLECPIDAAAEE